MFRDKHSADGGSFDRAQEKAGKGERQELIEIIPVNCRHSHRRQSLRHIAEEFHAACIERKDGRSDNGANYNEKSHRFVFYKKLSQNEHCQRD